MKPKRELTHHLFHIILRFVLFIAVFNIVTNTLIGFPVEDNWKWVFFAILAMITYFFTREKLSLLWKTVFFIYIIFVMLPVSFIESGGTQNNVMGYVFLLVICVTFFFWGHLRIFMICSIIIMFNVLLYIEFQFPQVVNSYPSSIHSIDRLTQTSILLLMAFLFLKIFSDTYAKDRERLNKLVHYDSLTELLNRRSFDDELNKVLEQSNRKSEYIIFFDIDYFKEINDTHGHHYGDEVLQEMADALKKVFIYPNIVARWGGDEFVALYHGDYETLSQKIESLYKDIDVYFSCGITQLKDNDVSADAILKRVDDALYASKDNGRNQWTYQE